MNEQRRQPHLKRSVRLRKLMRCRLVRLQKSYMCTASCQMESFGGL